MYDMGHFLLHFNDNFTVLKAELNNNELWKSIFLQGPTLRLREVGNCVILNLFLFYISVLKQENTGASPYTTMSRLEPWNTNETS
jgi:hypothetical protein